MSTVESTDGQTMTVTFRIGEGVSNEQARELIQSNTPEGLSISNIEDEKPSE